MSLNRVSYLEAWGQTRPSSRQQQQPGQEDGDSDSVDGRNGDLPDESISSSFQSTYSYRLNFNPYAGPGWTQPPDEGAHDELTPGLETPTVRPQPKPLDESDHGGYGPQGSSKLPDEDYPLQTTGAFEVSSTRRICMKPVSLVCSRSEKRLMRYYRPGNYCGHLLFPRSRSCVRICGIETCLGPGRGLSQSVFERRAL
jgi:hypothetical protein